MFGFNLESLVLCDVAVLRDCSAANLRLGMGYPTEPQTPEVHLSMRHPSHLVPGFPKPVDQRPDDADQSCGNQAVNGAGRSRSRDGVLRHSSASIGGPKATAATSWRQLTTQCVAPVSEALAASRRGRTVR
jgi:hypothetical protein